MGAPVGAEARRTTGDLLGIAAVSDLRRTGPPELIAARRRSEPGRFRTMPLVGWRETVYRWLDHGKRPPPPDPDALAEVAVVSLSEAAMLTAELRGRGLDAR